jgi:hypothetical protein
VDDGMRPDRAPTPQTPSRAGPTFVGTRGQQSSQSLADVLERVLDKGIVIVGDIQVRLLDIELLTIKVRLMIASVDRAREMGINWWEGDPFVSTLDDKDSGEDKDKAELQRRIDALEQRLSEVQAGEIRSGEKERRDERG